MSKLPTKIQSVQNELTKLSELKNFEQTQRVILSVIKLLDDTISEDNLNLFQLFNDSDGKIRANATWFYEDQIIADRKATYKIHADNQLNIDFKLYGVNKAKKQVISWATALTPNFEDEPFNSKFNVGIDFIIPKSTDRVVIVLTNNYVIRTLELKDNITSTYQEILSKWMEIKDFTNKSAVHNILWESFDLQPLNKKFYAGISERFITLRQHLIKGNIFDEKHSSMFANRLIGRVIFTWFLDKKGIINSDQKYFDSKSFSSDSDYYKNKLEKLFFNVLNTPVSEREKKDEGMQTLFGKDEKLTLFSIDDITPFLNGGLFEARENDLYGDSNLSFPKNYFDDLFDFLSGYNFTTDESTSQFQQVAIDPEMLGRIFENLLAEITEETGEQARKAKGAFYTPREIVDYMCKESLREYLKTKLPEDTYRDQRLYQLIDAPDKDFQDQDHNWRRDWKPYKDAILSALDDLKVLDPACGSGAFPIGMLQLLVRVYERLEPRFDGYKAKLQIIERNIYGVDIEPMAVEIARLRTWLSIIVDEESDSRKIKPLPNLEFKFVCANSLIDLDKSGENAFGDDPDLENKLRDIRDAYFNTESIAKKKRLRSDYIKLVGIGEGLFGESEKSKQLKTYRPFDNESSASFFNPEFMFGLNGFHIVLGNPPYGANIDSMLVEYKNLYPEVTKSYVEIYKIFFDFGLRIIRKDGIISYITPNTFLLQPRYKDLRKVILKYDILKIINLGENVFDQATVPVCISTIKKEKKAQKYLFCEKSKNGKYIGEIRDLVFTEIAIGEILNSQDLVLSKENVASEGVLSLEDVIELKDAGINYQRINVGLGDKGNTDLNERLFYEGELLDSENDKEYWKGTDIDKYFIASHTQRFLRRNIILKKNERVIINEKYFDIKPKLIWRQTASNLIAMVDERSIWFGRSIQCGWIKEKYKNEIDPYYLLGLFNSSYFKYLYRNIVNESSGRAFPQVKMAYLKKLPIKIIPEADQKSIIITVREIIEIRKQDKNNIINDLEEKNDELVMDLYGLSNEEKEVIRSSIK